MLRPGIKTKNTVGVQGCNPNHVILVDGDRIGLHVGARGRIFGYFLCVNIDLGNLIAEKFSDPNAVTRWVAA
jgi:hypothetical protein